MITSKEGQQALKEQQDSTKKVNTTYKNQKKNESELLNLQEELRKTTDPNAELKIENNISKVQSNIKQTIEKITKGKYEVVYYNSNNLAQFLDD